MDDNKKEEELYFDLWKYESSLMWERVQYMLVIFGGVFTAWFVLLKEMMESDKMSLLFLIVIVLLCIFGFIMSRYINAIIERDAEQMTYCESKVEVIKDLKENTGLKNQKKRGRLILSKITLLCSISCGVLLIISVAIYIYQSVTSHGSDSDNSLILASYASKFVCQFFNHLKFCLYFLNFLYF